LSLLRRNGDVDFLDIRREHVAQIASVQFAVCYEELDDNQNVIATHWDNCEGQNYCLEMEYRYYWKLPVPEALVMTCNESDVDEKIAPSPPPLSPHLRAAATPVVTCASAQGQFGSLASSAQSYRVAIDQRSETVFAKYRPFCKAAISAPESRQNDVESTPTSSPSIQSNIAASAPVTVPSTAAPSYTQHSSLYGSANAQYHLQFSMPRATHSPATSPSSATELCTTFRAVQV
jgi:hypothetical protein